LLRAALDGARTSSPLLELSPAGRKEKFVVFSMRLCVKIFVMKRIVLLILMISYASLSGALVSEVNVYPEDLARLKSQGASETAIQSVVQRLELTLSAKRKEAKQFQFVLKMIPSSNNVLPSWMIESNSVVLMTLRDPAGFASTKTRAEVVARQLNRALELGYGEFFMIERSGHPAVVFKNSRKPLIIATVSEQETSLYDTNYAEQWILQLNDFWQRLPSVLLHPLPAPLTFQDLIVLSKIGLAERTVVSFLYFRDIDTSVKFEDVKELKFNKEVTEYLATRLTSEKARQSDWGYSDSYGYCSGSTSITVKGSFGGAGWSSGVHAGAQRSGSARSGSGRSTGKSPHASTAKSPR